MEHTRFQRLEQKYGGVRTGEKAAAKDMRMGPPHGPGGMGAKGKPRDLKKTVGRLAQYLSREKGIFVLALLFSLIFTGASLVSSYLLRPVINRFIYFDASDSDLTE